MTSDNKKTAGRTKGSLKYIFSIVLAALFLLIAFRGAELDKVLKDVSNASLFWIFILVLSNLSSHFIRTLRWKVILRSVKKDTSLKYLFGSVMISYGVSCIIPRLGEITRAVLIGKWEKLSRSSMLGTIILERIIDVIFFCLAVLLSAIIWSGNIYLNFPWLKTALYITTFLVIMLFLFLFLVIKYKEKFYSYVTKILSRFSENAASKSVYVFEMLIQGFSSLRGAQNYILTFSLSVLLMLNYALNSYLGFFTLGMQSNVNFSMSWVLMSIGSIGVIIPTPGGIGSYHEIAKAVLTLLFHFPLAKSLAYAFLTHFVSYFLFIFSAVILFFLLNKQHENLFKILKSDEEK